MHNPAVNSASGFRGAALKVAPGPVIVTILLVTLFLTLESAPTVPFIPLATAFMLMVQVGMALLIIPFIRVRLSGSSSLILLLWAALFVWSLFSIFWSGYAPLSLMRVLMIYLPPLLLLLLIYADPHPVETFWKFARGCSFFGTCLALIALAFLVAGKTIALDQWEGVQVLGFGPFKISQSVHFMGSWPRVSSLTGNPNTLAAWLVFSLIFTYALYKARRISTVKFLLVGALQSTIMLATLSRTSIGTLVLGAALLWVLTARSAGSRFFKGELLAVGGIAGALAFFNHLFKHPRGEFLVRSTTVLSKREVIWAAAWKAIQDRPVTGCGFGVTYEAMLNDLGLDMVHLHNVYFSVLVEIGLVGFALFAAFWLSGVAVCWWRSFKHSSSGRLDSSLALAAAGSLLTALLFHQVFESMILRTNFYTILWVYLVGFATHPMLGQALGGIHTKQSIEAVGADDSVCP
ncbi:MAG TPA: O-antigen ligase family protein [Firmicutes bacterium]|nr:O-antigen ligase family protein [Bacillota bacterium]